MRLTPQQVTDLREALARHAAQGEGDSDKRHLPVGVSRDASTLFTLLLGAPSAEEGPTGSIPIRKGTVLVTRFFQLTKRDLAGKALWGEYVTQRGTVTQIDPLVMITDVGEEVSVYLPHICTILAP